MLLVLDGLRCWICRDVGIFDSDEEEQFRQDSIRLHAGVRMGLVASEVDKEDVVKLAGVTSARDLGAPLELMLTIAFAAPWGR